MRIAGRTFCRVRKFVPGRDHICRVLRGGVVARIEAGTPVSQGLTANRDRAACKRQIAEEIHKFKWKIYMHILEVLLKNTMKYSIKYCSYYKDIYSYMRKYTRMFQRTYFLMEY